MAIPRALQESLRAGRVIPFVGAGVSMNVLDRETGKRLFPSWRELLERAAKRLEEETRIAAANDVRALLGLSKPNYLEAARLAREGLGEPVWHKFLEEQLDYQPERARPESLALAQAIWKLNSHLIITTNYDQVLRWASSTHPVLWDREATAEMAAFLRNEKKHPIIWHLHGHIQNKSKIILTRDGYARLYPEATERDGETYYRAALQTLHSLLASHTFLFIGFSLDDAYFGMQLEGIRNIYQGAIGPHFVLMRKAELDRGISFGDAVQAIPFENFGEPLLQLLNELGAITGSKETPPTPQSPQRTADYNPRNYVFSVPFRQKGSQVIGREEALQAVRQQLTEGRRTAIGQAAAFQGLGGLGKTQLAVEYAYRFKDSYPNGVIWLNADQDIDAQLIELAESERARWIARESEHKYKLEIARHRLRTYSDCLIIFDNLESPQAIEAYLPEPQANPHILVTSRTDQPDFNPVPLDPLDESLSFELLLQEAGRAPVGAEEESAAREIAKSLGGLPLALELAGAYLRHRPAISWQQYRNLLSHNLKAALPGKLGSFTKHEADLYSTLKMDEEILKEDPKIKEILDLLTRSGSAPMGESLMCALLDVEDPAELTNALGLGTALRLLQKTPSADSYSIHRLVAEVSREERPLQEHQDWVDNICQRIGDWFEERRENFSDLFRFESEIDHLRAWQEHAREYAPRHSSRLIWLQAYPSYHRGQYQETKAWMEKALELFEKDHKGDLKLKASLLNGLSFCYSSSGDYKRSLEYAEQALELRLDLLGEQHRDTAASFSNVGVAYGNLGQYEKYLEYSEKALKIRLDLFGERHSDTAVSFSNVGNAYSNLEARQQALEYSEKALELRLDLLGERHPDTARSLNNVGIAYGHLGKYERALEYLEKGLSIRLGLFGERHPDTAISLNNVGVAYNDLGEHEQSLEYFKKALKLRREILGDNHPDTLISVNNLVQFLIDLDRRAEASQLLEEFLNKIPKDHIHYDRLKRLEETLLSKAVSPGSEQPSDKAKGRKKKKRR